MFNIDELEALRTAIEKNSRQYLKDWCAGHGRREENSLLRQFDAGIEKEVSIQIYCHENDSYDELWKTADSSSRAPGYYVRATDFGGCWYTVSDPLGYCERNSIVKPSILFLICGPGGEVIGASSNVNPKFPTLRQAARAEWDRIKGRVSHVPEDTVKDFWSMCYDGTTTLSINQWLLSFKDPEAYGKEIREMYGYDENWLLRRHETGRKVISIFSHLGESYAIYRVGLEHTICHAEFEEFYSGKYPMKELESYLDCYGSCFDARNTGPMETKKQAVKRMEEALSHIYPGIIGTVKRSAGMQILTLYSKKEAAEYLLKEDYRKTSIDEKIKKENAKHTFEDVTPGLAEKYENLCCLNKYAGCYVPVIFRNGKLWNI